METMEKPIVRLEADGCTSDEDVAFFRRWTREFPGVRWKYAVVDRIDGTLLCGERPDETVMMHLTHLHCGREWTNAQATITVLREAELGTLNELAERVMNYTHFAIGV